MRHAAYCIHCGIEGRRAYCVRVCVSLTYNPANPDDHSSDIPLCYHLSYP